MTADPMFPITEAVADLGVYLAAWARRDETKPQLQADLAGGKAITAIDAALRDLHRLRSQLVTEVRQHQDASGRPRTKRKFR